MPLVSTGPLTLECVCAGGATTPCSITDLDFIIQGWFVDGLGFQTIAITGGPGGTLTLSGNGSTALEPIGDWLAALTGLGMEYRIGRSTFDDYFGTGGAKFTIRATFLCVSPDGDPSYEYVYSNFLGGSKEICPDNGQAVLAGSTVAGAWWHSRPLSDCTFLTVADGGGFAPINANPLHPSRGSGDWCLCASGGTGFVDDDGNEFAPVYQFSIVAGSLPSGQSLDEDTGCIMGEPDGADPGTDSVTFRVLDMRDPDGGYADVTCGLILDGCSGAVESPTPNFFL